MVTAQSAAGTVEMNNNDILPIDVPFSHYLSPLWFCPLDANE